MEARYWCSLQCASRHYYYYSLYRVCVTVIWKINPVQKLQKKLLYEMLKK
jgi:hypothetical protein